MKKSHGLYLLPAVFLAAYALLSWFQVGTRPDKIGLHRCNSLEKLNEVGGEYSLIEADVCLRQDGTLDITHDVDTTFRLDLSSYFPYLQKRPDCRMWIDVKNLDETNRPILISALDSLCRRYSIAHERLIVESRRWDLLSPLTRKNYQTSYYAVTLPKPSSLSALQIDSVITHIDHVIASGSVCSISFPGWWYMTFRNQFRHRHISFLVWRHRTTEWEFFLDPLGRIMLADRRVQTILVKDKGNYHR